MKERKEREESGRVKPHFGEQSSEARQKPRGLMYVMDNPNMYVPICPRARMCAAET